jgi:hypothetical protein
MTVSIFEKRGAVPTETIFLQAEFTEAPASS